MQPGFCIFIGILKIKKMKYITLTLLFTLQFLVACNASEEKKEKITITPEPKEEHLLQNLDTTGLKKAYFASGCFWCVEAIYESIEGVDDAVSGYAGGKTINPTYEEVSTGDTGHAETVMVLYDPSKVSYKALVKAFFASHDPTTLNQQGPDHGTQYRSIAFYNTAEEKKIIQDYISQLKKDKAYNKPIVTEVKKMDVFYEAESYHQDFEKKNPFNPYILNVSKPRLERFEEKMGK